ncbi:hypothetical protein [Streptomyces sp. 8N706]|uniref:hypothetical protein n=1 Tax=Streptomyces sp. 8N706 TaxID=3457416 RepID=UPI003FCFEF55
MALGAAGPGSEEASAQAVPPGAHLTEAPAPGPTRRRRPERSATDRRWREKVTLDLHKTGDKPVTSGAVTSGTHIIGALGIDWATIESSQGLPVPIPGGQRRRNSGTVCADAWRVPLGMHLETRQVDADRR